MSRLDEIRNKLRSQIQDEKNQTIDSLRGSNALNRTNLRVQFKMKRIKQLRFCDEQHQYIILPI
jgi:hypothetical protein